MPLVMSTFGPSQSSSMTPTPGVASNLLSAEGISAENLPYVTVGGQVRRADYGKTIAGSLRLNRLMGVVGPVQQQNILQTLISANIKQYLSEGYTQQDTNTLKRSLGGGMAQFININRATGEMSTSIGTDPSYIAQQQQQAQSSAAKQLLSTIGPVASLQAQAVQARAKGNTTLANQLETQAAKQTAQDVVKNSLLTSIINPKGTTILSGNLGLTSGDIIKSARASYKTVADPFPKKAVITHSGNRIVSDSAPNCKMDSFNRLIRVGRYNNNVLSKFLR